MIRAIFYTLAGIFETLLGLRFLLRMTGANPDAAFVRWVYDWSTPLVAPFAGVFGQDPVIPGRGAVVTSVLDWNSLIALIVYAILFSLIVRLLSAADTEKAA